MVDGFIAHCYTKQIKYSKKRTFLDFIVCVNTITIVNIFKDL